MSTVELDKGSVGRWVTIDGTHVHIGKGGKIDEGPPSLIGKSPDEVGDGGANSLGLPESKDLAAFAAKQTDILEQIDAGKTWVGGPCGEFAEAVGQWLGKENCQLVKVHTASGLGFHVAVRVGDTFIDGRGIGSKDNLLTGKLEGGSTKDVAWSTIDNAISKGAATELAKRLRSEFPQKKKTHSMSKFYLHAQTLGDVKPALTLGQGYPTHRKIKIGDVEKDVPLAYFWKDTIAKGEYVHPRTKQCLSVTKERIDNWIETFNKMRAAGIEIPTPKDHSERAEDNLGFVIEAKRDGDRLSLLHQVIGEDAAMTALRNRCSLCIDPDFEDEKGRKWGDAFTHSAYTPNPVVTGMGEFVPFAASRDRQTETPIFYLSADQGVPEMDFKALRDALGAAADVPDDKLLDTVRQLKTDGAAALSRATKAEGERDAAKAEVVTLSRAKPDQPAKPSASEIFFASKAVKAARDEAVAAGAITPAVADQAEKTYLRKPVELAKITLSRAVEDDDHKVVSGIAALLDFYETVKGNKPTPPTGTQTGVQLLSRQVPGDNGDTTKLEEVGTKQGEAYRDRQLAARGVK